MLSEAHYSAALNYFFFLLSDEALALSAAYKSIKHAQKYFKKHPESDVDRVAIAAMHAVLEKFHGRLREPSSPPPESNWRVPNREYLALWREHMRKVDLHSCEALVLRYILGFKAQIISDALNVPEGTVYYRIGRGLEAFAQVPSFKQARA
jgi:DNA-directed RNA polymerase specialized sigma24 family protein